MPRARRRLFFCAVHVSQAHARAEAWPWPASEQALWRRRAAMPLGRTAAARRPGASRLLAGIMLAVRAARLPRSRLPARSPLLPAALCRGHVLWALDDPHPFDPISPELRAVAWPPRAAQGRVAVDADPHIRRVGLLHLWHVQAALRRPLQPLLGQGPHPAGLHLRRHVVAPGRPAGALGAAGAADVAVAGDGARVWLDRLRDQLCLRPRVGRPQPRAGRQRLRLPLGHLALPGPRFRHVLDAGAAGLPRGRAGAVAVGRATRWLGGAVHALPPCPHLHRHAHASTYTGACAALRSPTHLLLRTFFWHATFDSPPCSLPSAAQACRS